MILTSIGVAVFYFSYLVIFFLIYLIWQFDKLNGPVAIFLILACLLFLYARFLEPNIIKIRRYKIKLNKKITAPFRIAVWADPHIGLFTKSQFLKKVIKKVNQLKPDFILIPGDFVYNLAEKKIEDKFGCLKNLSVPTFAVFGGHDCGVEREKDVSGQLGKILADYGLKIIDNGIEEIKIKGQQIKIIGLSDIETRQPDYNLIKNLTDDDVNIVLAHNPDTAYEFPSYNMDLVVCGHTHGGQVRIYPFYKYAYKYIARMAHDFDKDLRNFRGTKVFITTGIGLDGLPFRFLMPPVIDILEIE
ncbi:MAG: metallophosphoesterase [Patescibacteria group bacterium]